MSNIIDLEQAKEIIDSVELSSVINRLVHIDKWSVEDAKEAVKQYRNFCFLRKKYPTKDLPPSKDIDEVWHAHILHSKDYCAFCDAVFGYYLHHTPGDANNNTETDHMSNLFEEDTQRLYKQEFGDYIYEIRSPTISILLTSWTKSLFKKVKLSAWLKAS